MTKENKTSTKKSNTKKTVKNTKNIKKVPIKKTTTTKKNLKETTTNKKENVKCIFNIDYGYGTKVLTIGEIDINKKDKKDEKKLKDTFLKNVLEKDINLFGKIIASLFSSAIAKKSLKSLISANLVKKNKFINVFIKQYNTNKEIKIGTIQNEMGLKPSKNINLELIASVIIDKSYKDDFIVNEMFLKILLNGKNQKQLSEEELIKQISETFDKIVNITYK